jgi:hypothetical protein
MSVLACCRESCPNVMCDRLVMGAYLCLECFRELAELKESWPEVMARSDVEDRIREFMATEPRGEVGNRDDLFGSMVR